MKVDFFRCYIDSRVDHTLLLADVPTSATPSLVLEIPLENVSSLSNATAVSNAAPTNTAASGKWPF